jgi:hypothetical protein
MGTQEISNAINSLFKYILPPFPQLSRLLTISSSMEKPGLSDITSVSNIVKELNNRGIPTGSMPDGSPNLTVAFANAIASEVYRAMKEDTSVQVGCQPGTMMLTAYGANGGGPIVVQGTNTSPGMLYGKIN